MQPIKISIGGDSIDCQLYTGRLYLWTLCGSLRVYDWNALVDSLVISKIDKITYEYCFLDGDYLYKKSFYEMMERDEEFRELLKNKFERAAQYENIVYEEDLNKFLLGEQESLSKLIPTDTEIYNNKLYFITERGLYTSNIQKRILHNPISNKFTKLWDCDLLSLKANRYPQIALSGGDEGLFELNMSQSVDEDLKSVEGGSSIYEISREHSSFANYSYLNLYNSSTVGKSFMASFTWTVDDNTFTGKPRYVRKYDKVVKEDVIFKNTQAHEYVSWGINEKIFRANEGGFEVVKFDNYAKGENGRKKFTTVAESHDIPWSGEVISGSSAVFGTIVECENAIIVILSDNIVYTIEGPITRWRTYIRSHNYKNHLHVILNDRIDIYSFNQDYFQEQYEKIQGIIQKIY